MKTFKRVALSANRDGYFSVIQEEDGEHWYGPWPSRTHAENKGKELAEHGPNSTIWRPVIRMRFK